MRSLRCEIGLPVRSLRCETAFGCETGVEGEEGVLRGSSARGKRWWGRMVIFIK